MSDLRSQFQAPLETQLVMSRDPAHLHQMKVINTEDDEDYVPDPCDLGGDPDGVEVKKTKAEGTYRVNI